jgi:hypothetical protein
MGNVRKQERFPDWAIRGVDGDSRFLYSVVENNQGDGVRHNRLQWLLG